MCTYLWQVIRFEDPIGKSNKCDCIALYFHIHVGYVNLDNWAQSNNSDLTMWDGSCYQTRFYKGGSALKFKPLSFYVPFLTNVNPFVHVYLPKKLLFCYLPTVGALSYIPFWHLFIDRVIWKSHFEFQNNSFLNPFLYINWSLKFLPFFNNPNLKEVSLLGGASSYISLLEFSPPPSPSHTWLSTYWQIYIETC